MHYIIKYCSISATHVSAPQHACAKHKTDTLDPTIKRQSVTTTLQDTLTLDSTRQSVTTTLQDTLTVQLIGLSDHKKEQQSHYSLDRPLGFQEVEAHRFSRQSAHEGGKVVSPTHRPPFYPPGKIPGTHFC
jgi:hypothetical protein